MAVTGTRPHILLTGATGYIGGRLLPALRDRGYSVRCLARDPKRLAARADEGVEVTQGDLLRPETVTNALVGIHTAFYLVHSMGGPGSFDEQDREAAVNFARAAKEGGVQRIIYVGGLGDDRDPRLSRHLASRHEVGRLLREYGPEVIELRASVVIGSGSLSYEIMRSLTHRLPVMVAPRWVSVLCQPIAVEDLLDYLLESIGLPPGESRVYEVGGADQVSYGDLIRIYAGMRGMKRLLIPVPVLTPRLSGLWLALVTPAYYRVGRQLIESLRSPTVVRDHSAHGAFTVRPRGVREALERAQRHEDADFAQTSWSDALSSVGGSQRWGGRRFGARLVDHRAVVVGCSPSQAFEPIQRIGGRNGWYYANLLWALRGFLDRLAMGPGLRRGRRDPVQVRVGDAIDFWRVEEYEPGRKLRLAAEMRVPGRAWLEFEVLERDDGAEIRQTAIFDPVGLTGQLYWYALWPIHSLVFGGMLRRIAARAMRPAEAT